MTADVLGRLADGEPLTAADVAALTRLDQCLPGRGEAGRGEAGRGEPGRGEPGGDNPGGDVPGGYPAGACAEGRWPSGGGAWPDDLTDFYGEPVAARPRPEVFEALDAGFTHRGEHGGSGFAAGGALDRMPACAELAAAADQAWSRGLGELSDDELAGLMGAQRRLSARATAGELATIRELSARRSAADGTPGEHVPEEVAALLTLTGTSAARQVALADGVGRLPGVASALAAGRIDGPKAAVFVDELIALDELPAAAIAAIVAGDAPDMTTSQLRRALRREVIAFDPSAAARRKQRAEKQARVECWTEPSGTGAIAGRDLDLAAVIAADQSIDADARWLKQHGLAGTLDQLRARAFLARITGQSLDALLPPAPRPDPHGRAATVTGPAPESTAGPTGLVNLGLPMPVSAGPTGLVNLTLPALSWLGRSDTPGEVAGYGTVDAGTCRDLAGALARQATARWCVTLVDQRGRAVAHGCARAGPGPPGSDWAGWLASVQITPIESGSCSHRRQSPGYRPSATLRHIVKVRSPRCGFPGCRRSAARCDDDHTIPHHRGGKTCECNLHPLCRRHHACKQAPGWRLDQPEPGILTWTLPSGRQVSVLPEPYPV